MPDICKKCGYPRDISRDEKTGKRRRRQDHVCPTVVIQRKKKDDAIQSFPTKTVHENRVSKGGDLHDLVTGDDAPWSVVFRNRQKIEKKIEDRKAKSKAKKAKKKTLVAPSGEPLTPPKG
jgi:hypothetical protein